MDLEINSQTFTIRALTRGEVRALKKSGYVFFNLTKENHDDVMDLSLGYVLSDDEIETLDGMPYRCSVDVFKAVIGETVGDPDAEKNL